MNSNFSKHFAKVSLVVLLLASYCTRTNDDNSSPSSGLPTAQSQLCQNGWCWQNPLPQGHGLLGIWDSSPNDVFAVGMGGTILHSNGTTWQEMNSNSKVAVTAVWGKGPSDVFAWDADCNVLHYDGNAQNNWERLVGISQCFIGIKQIKDTVFAWAGAANKPAGEASSIATSLFFYDGKSWQAVPFSESDLPADLLTNSSAYLLKGIWGTSASDLFVALQIDNGRVGDAGGVVMHYDGKKWQISLSRRNELVYSIAGTTSSDIFVSERSGLVDHFDGTNWSQIALKDVENNQISNLYKMWDIAGAGVFAIGVDAKMQWHIYHYNGAAWQASGMIKENLLEYGENRQIWGLSSNDIWYLGVSGQISHYDGKSWSDFPQSILPDNHFYSYPAMNALWGLSTNDVFVVGYGTTNAIHHYDGISWQPMIIDGESKSFNAIWGTDRNNVWAVGGALEMTNGRPLSCIVYRYNGFTWVPQSLVGLNLAADGIYSLQAIWGSGANDVYMVGRSADDSKGVILHYDGKNWTKTLSTLHLNSIWGNGPNDVYAVPYSRVGSEQGTFMHYDGKSWSYVSAGPSMVYHTAMWGSSSKDIYLLGIVNNSDTKSTLFHFDGQNWIIQDTLPKESVVFSSLIGLSANNIYLLGEAINRGYPNFAVLIHYDGKSWKEIPLLPAVIDILQVRGNDIWGNADGVFALGWNNQIIYHSLITVE